MRAEDFTPDIAWGRPQYRRRRSAFGRDIDRLLRWLRERALPITLLVGTLTIPAYAVIELVQR